MDFQNLIRSAVDEGIVLLKNEKKTLPFSSNDKVALFGRCQIDYYKSGTGSGGSVHVPYSVNLLDGFDNLKAEGFAVPDLDQSVREAYISWIKLNPFDNGNGEWASEPWCQKEMLIDDEFASMAAEKSNKAVFVIGRTAGEDQDNSLSEGSYYLTQDEKSSLKSVCNSFEQVTAVLNVSNIIDLSWINDPCYKGHITAVVISWQGGMQGGQGCADVLCGKANPSGKLSDSIALSYEDYPSSANFGSASDEIYAEDIFVGYRYFTTFAKDRVLYPFGFGLSYTTFDISDTHYQWTEQSVKLFARVTNTGDTPGKQTVQFYVKCPQGKLGKSELSLCGYKKTKELLPGQSEEVCVEVSVYDFASYDDSGITGNPFCYVLEKGTYYFYAGESSADVKCITNTADGPFIINETKVIEKLSQCCAPERDFLIMKASDDNEGGITKSFVNAFKSNVNLDERIKQNEPYKMDITGDRGIRFGDVVKDKSLLDKFVAQLNEEELMTLVRGEGMMSRKVTSGIASAFGGVSERLHDYGIVAAGCSDGPSGIRLDNGKEATLIPIGTLLACTWNDSLVEALYAELGREMIEKNIDILLGPGCNIHRNPLNGRNFEYFSEDPLLTGNMAASVCKGLRSAGAHGTVKHFALNNQERHRRDENSVASERAIREIYLKPFEIAVKKGGADCIMTSYNGINGHWSASNYDLNSTVLRGEWGFNGLVMTDWWAAMNDCVRGGDATVRNIAQMVKARNNVYMVVVNDTADKGGFGDNLADSLKNGYLSLGELQLCAKDIISFLCTVYAATVPLRPLKNEIRVENVIEDVPSDALLYSVRDNVQITDEVKTLYVKISTDGTYNICGSFYKDGGDTLSQSITNLMINDVHCGSFECRSTDGKVLYTTAAQLELSSGVYKVDLIDTKPGIDVRSLCVTPEAESPVTSGAFI